MNRVYPCKSIIVGSREKVEVKKVNEITEEEIMEEKPPIELKYKIKAKVNSYDKNKLEKE